MSKFHFTILAFLLIFSCTTRLSSQSIGKVSDWPRGVSYEIFVQSFADSNGDGIGDFKGMTSKLDYLKDLGVEGVWLMPINPSTSYHKYNVDDYYDVHPDYGTLKDFKEFVDEAHKRGIHVVIDLVINHSGRENLWFKEALKDEHIKYWDYYVWAHKDDPQVQPAPGSRRSNWNAVKGSDYMYFSHFGASMPDLNYDNPKLRQEIFNIGRFWLSEMNVDGFRLDAARHIFSDVRKDDMYKWWEYFLQEMKKVREDVYIVGEVWSTVEEVAPYLKGIPALFNFDIGSAIITAVNEEKGGGLAERHKGIMDVYRSVNPDYIDNTFLTNHDQNRILSSLGGNISKAKLAASILLTLPGSPYLYYGEEIGMLGEKPDPFIREPFIWDVKSKDVSRTTWEVPRHSTEPAVTPLSLQISDVSSIFNHYRRLIELRNGSFALTYGELVPVKITTPSISAFIRSDARESLLVMHNLSKTDQSVRLPSNLKNYGSILFSDKEAQINNGQVKIPAYSTVIFVKSNP
jgi:glycosidase